MSIRAIVWAFDAKCPSPTAKLVLIKLADHANEEGECWPSQGRVAADCGLPRETVNRQIKALSEAGLIRVENRTNGHGKQPNRYFLLCDLTSHSDVISDHNPCDLTSHKPSINRKEEDSEATPLAAAPPPDPVKEIFDRGVAIVGTGRRAFLGKIRRQYGDPAVMAAIVACESELPSEPLSFLMRCCERIAERGSSNGHRPGPISQLYAGFAAAVGAGPADSRLDRPSDVPLLDRQ